MTETTRKTVPMFSQKGPGPVQPNEAALDNSIEATEQELDKSYQFEDGDSLEAAENEDHALLEIQQEHHMVRVSQSSPESAYGVDKDFESISNDDQEHRPMIQLQEGGAGGASHDHTMIKHTANAFSFEDGEASPDDLNQTPESVLYAEHPLVTQPPKTLIQRVGSLQTQQQPDKTAPKTPASLHRSLSKTETIVARSTSNQARPFQPVRSTATKGPDQQRISMSPIPPHQTALKQQTNSHMVGNRKNQQSLVKGSTQSVNRAAEKQSSSNVRSSYSKFLAAQYGGQVTGSQRQQPAFVMPVADSAAQNSVGNTARKQGGGGSLKRNKNFRSKTVKPKLVDPNLVKVAVQAVSPQNSQPFAKDGIVSGSMAANTKNVDVLVIGAGPASLGFLVAAVKQSRFAEILQDDGIAILDQGVSFGGGMLCNYGINSNTSANSFLKCIMRKHKDQKHTAQHPVPYVNQPSHTVAQTTSNLLVNKDLASSQAKAAQVKRRQKSVGKERLSQPQVAKVPEKSQQRERHMSLSSQKPASSTQKWVGQVPSVAATLDEQAALAAEQKEQPVVPQNEDEVNTVAQPQDPDMADVAAQQAIRNDVSPDTALPLNQETSEVKVLLNSKAQSLAASPQKKKSASRVKSPINTIKQDFAQALQDRPKKHQRRKSREEASNPGRGSKGAHKGATTVSQHRNHSKTAGLKQGGRGLQTGILMYAHNASHGNGTNPAQIVKNLTAQFKARVLGDPYCDKKLWSPDDVLTPFKELFPSNISCMFRRLNKQIVPLSVVGHLLNYVGNHLLHHAYKSTGKRIYMPKHKALSVHLMGNGEIMTQVLKTDFKVVPDTSKSPPTFEVVEGQQSIVYFRSKALLIAGGAKQGIDPRVNQNWFPDLDPSKLIASDSFLKKHVYLEQANRLKDLEQVSQGEAKRRPKVVIIGGSHSGFSCAWLLLNGPAMYQKCFKTLKEHEQQAEQQTEGSPKAKPAMRVPYACRKQIKNCLSCCSCGNSVFITSQKLAAQKDTGNTQNQRHLEEQLRSHSKAGSRMPRGLSVATRELSPINKNMRLLSKTIKQKKDLHSLKTQTQPGPVDFKAPAHLTSSPDPKRAILHQKVEVAEPVLTGPGADNFSCTCVCKCFGYFQYDEWPNKDSAEPIQLPQFEESDIKILYRDRIKVFFKTAREATDAGYSDFDATERANKKKDGYIYSFTGLRGDAKQMYLDVTAGKEKRVAFVKAETPELQKTYVEEADLVIWACGYQSNAIKIYDVNKSEMQLSQKVPNTQFDVDGKNRVMLADGDVLNKVFACGVGFPVRTKDGGAGNLDPTRNPRADSFSLYMHTVGEVLLKSLLPKKKIAMLSHKEAANPYLKAATYEQIMKDKQQKNKKPLFQQVSTKKEKSTTKLAQLANPARLLPRQSELIESANKLEKEMSNVYMQYLNKARPGLAHGNIQTHKGGKAPHLALNNDLEELSGFGMINTLASKSNCFSHRGTEFDQIDGSGAQDLTLMQKTGFSDAQFSKADLIEASRVAQSPQATVKLAEPTLKFPDISRDSQFVNSAAIYKEGSRLAPALTSDALALRQSDDSLINLRGDGNITSATELGGDHSQILKADDDLNDRENSLSVGVLPSHILIQQIQNQTSKRGGLVPANARDSQKSLDARASTQSRNTQAITPAITGKSPLLLQKKQQMVIQKTKESVTTTDLPVSYQHLGTMSNLKAGKDGPKVPKKSMLNVHKTQVAGKVGSKPLISQAQDLLKRHTALIQAVDQSPYMHFGVANAGPGQGDKIKKHTKGISQKKSAPVERAVLSELPSKDSGDGSLGSGQTLGLIKGQVTSAAILSAGGSKSKGYLVQKNVIQSAIHQTQKAFSEREQSMLESRYTLKSLQGGTGTNRGKAYQAKKEHTHSVELQGLKQGHISLAQQLAEFNQTPLPQKEAYAESVQPFGVDSKNQNNLFRSNSRETFGQNLVSQGNIHQAASVKSMISNSELFPPIVNKPSIGAKNLQPSITSTRQQLQVASHLRKHSLMTNHQHTESVKSLAASSQHHSTGRTSIEKPSHQTDTKNSMGLARASEDTTATVIRNTQGNSALKGDKQIVPRSKNVPLSGRTKHSGFLTSNNVSVRANHASSKTHQSGTHSQVISRTAFAHKKQTMAPTSLNPISSTVNGLMILPEAIAASTSSLRQLEEPDLNARETTPPTVVEKKSSENSLLRSPMIQSAPPEPQQLINLHSESHADSPGGSLERQVVEAESPLTGYEDDQFNPESARKSDDPDRQQTDQQQHQLSGSLQMQSVFDRSETTSLKTSTKGVNRNTNQKAKTSKASAQSIFEKVTRVGGMKPNLRQPTEVHLPKVGDVDQLEGSNIAVYATQGRDKSKPLNIVKEVTASFETQPRDSNKLDKFGSLDLAGPQAKVSPRLIEDAQKEAESNLADAQAASSHQSEDSISIAHLKQKRLGEASSGVVSQRRQGFGSMTDVLTPVPQKSSTKTQPLKPREAQKKSQSGIGQFERFMGEQTATKTVQPYLESAYNKQSQPHSSNSLTTKPGPAGRRSNGKLSLRQRQVLENQNARFKQLVQGAQAQPKEKSLQPSKGGNHAVEVTPKKQMTVMKGGRQSQAQRVDEHHLMSDPSLTATARLGSPDANDKALKSAKHYSKTLKAQNQYQQRDTTPFVTSTQTTKTVEHSAVKGGYKQTNGFFVHKTIRDLSIKQQSSEPVAPADSEDKQPTGDNSLADATQELKSAQNQTIESQLKTIKKGVQAKAANLSPVLKRRGQSKAALQTSHTLHTNQAGPSALVQQQQIQAPAKDSSQFKSPVRANVSSASSYTAHKDRHALPTSSKVAHKAQNLRSPKLGTVSRRNMNSLNAATTPVEPVNLAKASQQINSASSSSLGIHNVKVKRDIASSSTRQSRARMYH